MTEMKRLLDHGATGFEAMLLGQAAEEQPDDARVARMLAAMPSVGVAAGAGSTAGTGMAGGNAAGGTAAGNAGATGVSGSMLAGIGLALGSLLLAGLWMNQRADENDSGAPEATTIEAPERPWTGAVLGEASQSDVASAASSREDESEKATELSPAKNPSPEVVPKKSSQSSATQVASPGARAEPVVSEPAAAPEQAVIAPKTPSSLREEISLLEGVRAQIARGEKSAALARLSRYRAKFPQGTLAAEARVLSTRALKLAPQK